MEFGLDPEKHIVATSGDGASAMVSFGSMIISEYVQCSDHGINLGVTKVLYLKKQSADAPVDDDDDDFFFVECGNEDEPDEDVPDAARTQNQTMKRRPIHFKWFSLINQRSPN